MDKDKEKLQEIVDWLNENYNQDSENYSIFFGAKPEVIKYDEHTAISFWACGAIVCIGHYLYFIEEDDGNWFMEEEGRCYAFQTVFSVAWAESFANAMKDLKEYTEKNGKPIYYSGTQTICYYVL